MNKPRKKSAARTPAMSAHMAGTLAAGVQALREIAEYNFEQLTVGNEGVATTRTFERVEREISRLEVALGLADVDPGPAETLLLPLPPMFAGVAAEWAVDRLKWPDEPPATARKRGRK